MKRLFALCAVAAVSVAFTAGRPRARADTAIKLPAGFTATLFADSLPGPRHMEVAPNGDLIVSLRGSGNPQNRVPGGVVVLRDENGDGKADKSARFGSYSSSEARLLGNALYVETGTAILRYPWKKDAMEPAGPPDTIVSGLPSGGHGAKTFVIHNGRLFVNQGSRTNSCQERDRQKESKGLDPCPELTERAGIFIYSAEKRGQTLKDGERFAAGVRNAVAMAIEPRSNELYVMQHGRDQLDMFPGFTPEQNATATAEELLRVRRGDDYGWPYCYYDLSQNKRVLAPEYGGDGKQVGRCANTKANVGVFPAHWAPNGLLFYTGREFPAKYRNGAFVAFHGSWNRAPLAQQGYRVVFQPMSNGRASGEFETFADGFVDSDGKPTEMGGRPTGLVQGRKGEMYLSDDTKGRIYRITYLGK